MYSSSLKTNLANLEAAMPVLIEKEKAGLIRPDSVVKARSLLAWGKSERPMSEKQELFVGTLLARANRKHIKANIHVNTGTNVNVDEIVDKVMAKVGNDKIDPELIVGAVLKKVNGEFSDSVIASVVKTLDERLPRKVEIVVKNAETGKTLKLVGARHKNFERLLKIASLRGVDGQRLGIFLSGEASSGKTTGSKQVAEALGLKWYFNGAISLPHEMLGFIDGAGTYHRTPFRDAYEFGGVYTFDEVDRSDPNALLAVNPHLANGVATFPDKQVKRHKDCIIICTANTWGLGADANYSGATKLDAAFLSRFPVKIAWDIDLDLEFAIVNNKEWLARVRKARANARAVGLKVMIDVRTSLAGSTLIDEGGYSSDEAAEMTYLANLKPEQRKQIELV
jgi:cobaltochelatase CobS